MGFIEMSTLRSVSPAMSYSQLGCLALRSAENNHPLHHDALRLVWHHPLTALTSLNSSSRLKRTSNMKVSKSRHLWRQDTSMGDGVTCDIVRRATDSEKSTIDSSSPPMNKSIHVNGTSVNGALPAGAKARVSTPSVESTEKPTENGSHAYQMPILKTPSVATDQQRFHHETKENLGLLTQSDKMEKIPFLDNDMKLLQGLLCTESQEVTETIRSTDKDKGFSIVEFLKGKNIFITGATGFLAKVLVEKILRVQPDVGQLFLLIKAKDVHSAEKRLREEIVYANLFNLLRTRHGNSYEGFMKRKLTSVVGDITLDNLGLDPNTANSLSTKLHVIVNSAASTTFDERYDHALNLNTKGPQRILEFSKRCPRLQLLMHVSTAFVNGERKGLVHEQPFRMGQSIANEINGEQAVPDLDVDLEVNIIRKKVDAVLAGAQATTGSYLEEIVDKGHIVNGYKEKILTQAMKELGLQRAKLFGWQDTYVFTKAMGEMIINKMKEHLPVVIVRPSVVESSISEPFPGWMEGNRMMDPIILSYGKGQLTGFLVDPKGVLDVIPVDMVANAMLAAMAKHACKPGLQVYQVASSVINPLIFDELSRISHEHFIEHPYIDNAGKPVKPERMHLHKDMESFMESICRTDQQSTNKLSKDADNERRQNQLIMKAREQAAYLASLYKPYTFYAGRFDNSNTKQLYDELSTEERHLFRFEVEDINWENYIKKVHIPGLRKHVLKGRGSIMD